jgi:uncharacterized membrane protein
LSIMNDFSFFILDFSSILFSFSLLPFITAISIAGKKNFVPNDDQRANRKVLDLVICVFSSLTFFFLFAAIEYLQTNVMTNFVDEEKTSFYVYIVVSIILIALFFKYSSKLINNYEIKIKITL